MEDYNAPIKRKTRVSGKRHKSVRILLAENLRILMEDHPIYKTQVAVAEASGLSQSHISLILRAEKHKTAVSIDTLEKVANVFGVDPWQLLINVESYAKQTVLNSQLEASLPKGEAKHQPVKKTE